jgi:hypothetical protein
MYKSSPVEHAIEVLCHKGCRQVWREILALERGERLPETEGLSAKEQRLVLQELKSIMAVYGDRCSID